MKLCAPAILYLILSVIALVLNFQYSIKSFLLHVVFICIWTFILNWICKKGYKPVSWGLVILPYLFAALVILIAAEFIHLKRAGYLENFTEGASINEIPLTNNVSNKLINGQKQQKESIKEEELIKKREYIKKKKLIKQKK